jgi:hypothetical protein
MALVRFTGIFFLHTPFSYLIVGAMQLQRFYPTLLNVQKRAQSKLTENASAYDLIAREMVQAIKRTDFGCLGCR